MTQVVGASPSQTVGPFFEAALLRDSLNVLAGPGVFGERIRIDGRILDGDGAPVPDALVEIWQANAHGRYHHPADARDLPLDPGFTGFGRSGTDDLGRFWFETVRPGPVQDQAPHLAVTVFARGLLNHLHTRIYFADDPRNDTDPILRRVPGERRQTLLAAQRDGVFQIDLRLQGDHTTETPFFSFRR